MTKDCPKRKKVVILGSTGSIGTSALKVARELPQQMEVVGLAAGRNSKVLIEQAREFGVKNLSIADPEEVAGIQAALGPEVQVHAGTEGLTFLSTLPEAEMVLVSIVGTAGLAPTLAAIGEGKEIALASKEVMVMAGEYVMERAAQKGVRILPVDSEHNALFQCLEGHHGGAAEVRRLILTASGGPFRDSQEWPIQRLAKVTLQEALRHPTWTMGQKITLDSATLFNKALEMIEARWLFGIPMEKIDVTVHHQSIVHSMVEFADHSVLAQLSQPDMCFPIQYAVTWPQRSPNGLEPLDFAQIGELSFAAPRRDAFPALDLAVRAGTVGGTMPAVLNAANEVAVQAFIEGTLRFPEIAEVVQATMEAVPVRNPQALKGYIEADQEARDWALEKTQVSC